MDVAVQGSSSKLRAVSLKQKICEHRKISRKRTLIFSIVLDIELSNSLLINSLFFKWI